MKATAWEFRYRRWLIVAIMVLGAESPWVEWLQHGSSTTHTWGWLAFQLGGVGMSSASGFELVAALAIAAAALGAGLRVWATAYLGTTTVLSAEMSAGAGQMAGQILADGPYRNLRNPLYLGSFFTMLAIALLLPPSGAAVSLSLLAIFLFRLILGEESFLSAKLGQPYDSYRSAVPRLLPSLRPRLPATGAIAHWGRALLGEIFPLGVFVSFAAWCWQYNPLLLSQAVVVSFGVSLVVRALLLPAAAAGPAGS